MFMPAAIWLKLFNLQRERGKKENEVGISVVLAVASDTTTTYEPHEGYQPYAAIIS